MSDRVGYRNPPRSTRWAKGQSGNPQGRAKGCRNLRTELAAELSETIQILEGGSPRRISKQRALLKALTAKAIQGDSRAAGLLLNLMARLFDAEPSVAEAPAGEDEAIVEAFLQRRIHGGPLTLRRCSNLRSMPSFDLTIRPSSKRRS
jgi:hypothetical protein